jgi:pilus assembly protein Flp/PilA
MLNLILAARRLVADKKGVTALEYGMIAALISAVIVGTVSTIGQDILTAFQTIEGAL